MPMAFRGPLEGPYLVQPLVDPPATPKVNGLVNLHAFVGFFQLGWIAASTQGGKDLAVQSVLPPLPSISSLRWEDWGLRPLLLEQAEQHLQRANEGQGIAFASPCFPHLFRVQLAEPLHVSQSTVLTVSYILGSSRTNRTPAHCVSSNLRLQKRSVR